MMDAEIYNALHDAKNKAEDVQAMFGGIKAVLSAAEEQTGRQLVQNEFGGGCGTIINLIGGELQELLGVVAHLLLEMEQMQDELVHQLSEKTFAARNELVVACAVVNGAKDG